MTDLNDRLSKIEERLEIIEKELSLSTATAPPNLQIASISYPTIEPLQTVKQSPSPSLLHWFKENWLPSIGIFFVLLASAWFVSYAFSNNWINELTRFLLSIVAGIAVYGFGIFTLSKHLRGGQILITLGIALSFLSLYTGYQDYHLLSASFAFTGMTVLALLTAGISLKKNLKGLAFISIMMIIVVPPLIGYSASIFLNYILLTDLVAIFMFVRRGWGGPLTLAWLGTTVYTSEFHNIKSNAIIWLFIAIFYLIFFLPVFLSICGKIKQKLTLNGLFLQFTTAITLIYWIYNFVPPYWNIVCYGIAAILSFTFGYILSRRWNHIEGRKYLKNVLAWILGFNVMIFALSATREIDPNMNGDMSLILYLLVGTLFVSIGRFIFQSYIVTTGLALYFLPTVIPLSMKFLEILYTPTNSLNFAILCIATVSFTLSAFLVRYRVQFKNEDIFQQFISILLGVATLFSFMMLIWNLCYNFASSENVGRFMALTIYIVAAEILVFIGNLKQRANIRLAGIAVLLFVICRLLAFEAWLMPIEIRTITFIVAGLLFIGTAFFDKRCKRALMSPSIK